MTEEVFVPAQKKRELSRQLTQIARDLPVGLMVEKDVLRLAARVLKELADRDEWRAVWAPPPLSRS